MKMRLRPPLKKDKATGKPIPDCIDQNGNEYFKRRKGTMIDVFEKIAKMG